MHEIDDDRDLIGEPYVERDTSLLYEVKFFEDFVIVRPASPTFYLAIRKLDYNTFANEFEEYWGDHEAFKEALRGMAPEIVIN